jgi:hypothetical protein
MPNLLQLGKQGDIVNRTIDAYNHVNLAGPLIERAGAHVGTRRPAPRARPTGHPPVNRAVLRIRDTLRFCRRAGGARTAVSRLDTAYNEPKT